MISLDDNNQQITGDEYIYLSSPAWSENEAPFYGSLSNQFPLDLNYTSSSRLYSLSSPQNYYAPTHVHYYPSSEESQQNEDTNLKSNNPYHPSPYMSSELLIPPWESNSSLFVDYPVNPDLTTIDMQRDLVYSPYM